MKPESKSMERRIAFMKGLRASVEKSEDSQKEPEKIGNTPIEKEIKDENTTNEGL